MFNYPYPYICNYSLHNIYVCKCGIWLGEKRQIKIQERCCKGHGLYPVTLAIFIIYCCPRNSPGHRTAVAYSTHRSTSAADTAGYDRAGTGWYRRIAQLSASLTGTGLRSIIIFDLTMYRFCRNSPIFSVFICKIPIYAREIFKVLRDSLIYSDLYPPVRERGYLYFGRGCRRALGTVPCRRLTRCTPPRGRRQCV